MLWNVGPFCYKIRPSAWGQKLATERMAASSLGLVRRSGVPAVRWPKTHIRCGSAGLAAGAAADKGKPKTVRFRRLPPEGAVWSPYPAY
jgi:hypothetical protein